LRVLTHPEDFISKSNVNIARESFHKANICKFSNPIEALEHYKKAAEYFDMAANEVADVSVSTTSTVSQHTQIIITIVFCRQKIPFNYSLIHAREMQS
jgi:hypothetical protein